MGIAALNASDAVAGRLVVLTKGGLVVPSHNAVPRQEIDEDVTRLSRAPLQAMHSKGMISWLFLEFVSYAYGRPVLQV